MKRTSRALFTFCVGFLAIGIVLVAEADMTVRGALELFAFGLAATCFVAGMICSDQPPKSEAPDQPAFPDGAQI